MATHRSDTPRRRAADARFGTMLGAAVDLARARGGALPTAGSDDPDEVRLARWLAKRRWEANSGILAPARESALDAALPTWRATTHSREGFAATLEECVAWRRENGSLPRSAGGEADETRLGLWLTARRYDARRGRLPRAHADLLDERLGAWRAAAVSEDRFSGAVSAIASWLDGHGRLPEAVAADPREAAMGAWLAAARRARSEGRLTARRHRELSAAVPGWESPVTGYDRAFAVSLDACAQWVRAHRRLPGHTRRDDEEKRHAVWLSNRRADRRLRRLAPGREQAIDRAIPGWDIGLALVG